MFSFPILPEPACFAYSDGTSRQNDKLTVFHHLTNDFQSNPPDTIETAIANGMFILSLSTQNLSKTYSALARRIIVKVLNLTNIRADLCFDIFESPSIKDVRRKDRGDIGTEREFCIGPRLKSPSNFNELLKISSFKSSFVDFLMKQYENIEYASMIGEKEFYCSIDNKYTKFYCVEGSLKFETIPELFGDHLAGDARVMFHAKQADIKGTGNIIIWGDDTDIFIILLANVQKLSQSHLWFDRGLGSDNSRNYVDISKLFKELDNVKALPGIYAYTGIDYLPALYRKGKVRPLLLMTKKQKFVDAFVALGNLDLQNISSLILKNLPVTCMVTQRINALMMC